MSYTCHKSVKPVFSKAACASLKLKLKHFRYPRKYMNKLLFLSNNILYCNTTHTFQSGGEYSTEQSLLKHFHWKCVKVHKCLHYHLTEVFLCVSSLHTTCFTQSCKCESNFKSSGNREVHSLQRFIFHRRARLGKTKYCRVLHESTGILETMNFQLFFLDNANLKEKSNIFQ